MRISPIQKFPGNNICMPAGIQKTNTNPASVSLPAASDSYGKALLSFRGVPDESIMQKLANTSFEDKLSYALSRIDIGEFLVVSKNFEKAGTILNEVVDRIHLPIESIVYMKEPQINESLFFYVTPKNETMLLNPNDKSIRLNGFEEIEPDMLGKLDINDHLRFSNGWNKIKPIDDIPDDVRELLDCYYDKYVQIHDYSLEADKLVSGHNQKVVKEFAVPKSKQVAEKRGFAQVGGQDKLIDKLKKHVLFPLKYPEAFNGLMLSKGVILYGPPGTGKTLLAQALAAEAGASAFELCATDLESKYVGESEANCRKLFQEAVDAQPSIICFDEFDALGKSRGGNDVHGDKLLNQLLSLMSDIEKRNDKVVVLASTNRKEALDNAILRSGRFDLHLEVKAPDLAGTRQILDIKLNNKPIDKSVDIDRLSERMYAKKMTGADISAVVRNAHINALEREGIYKSMETGRYSPVMMSYFNIKEEDFQKAIDEFNPKDSQRKPIGFVKN